MHSITKNGFRMKQLFSLFFALCALALALFFPAIVLDGAQYGLALWAHTLVPTLLPFLILSGLFIQSGLVRPLMALPGKYSRKYLGISPAGLYALLCGFFFGYPSGGKILADLLKTGQIDKKEASWLMIFCSNLSPAFLSGYVLSSHLHRPDLAFGTFLILYGVPAFLCLIPRFFLHRRSSTSAFPAANTQDNPSSFFTSALLDTCIQDAISVMLKLGGYIMLFSILANIVSHFHIFPQKSCALLIAALEITNGIPAILSAFPWPANFVILLPFLTFGGLCSMMQTGSVIKDTPLSLHPYFLGKLLLTIPVLLLGLVWLF